MKRIVVSYLVLSCFTSIYATEKDNKIGCEANIKATHTPIANNVKFDEAKIESIINEIKEEFEAEYHRPFTINLKLLMKPIDLREIIPNESSNK
jgi:hypothetical protein